MSIDLLKFLNLLTDTPDNITNVTHENGVKKAVIFSTEAPLSSSSKSFILYKIGKKRIIVNKKYVTSPN